LDAQRDWGFAGDYVKAMWLILQQPEAEDYIIATAETHSIRDMLDIAFSRVGLDWEERVEVDPKLLRPAEVDYLCGNATKARERLGWAPQVDLKGLIEMMVDADLRLVRSSLKAVVATSN